MRMPRGAWKEGQIAVHIEEHNLLLVKILGGDVFEGLIGYRVEILRVLYINPLFITPEEGQIFSLLYHPENPAYCGWYLEDISYHMKTYGDEISKFLVN